MTRKLRSSFVLLLALLMLGAVSGAFAQTSEGLELIRKANNGDSHAQNDLGWAYQNGDYGLTRDYQQAVYWYTKAANQGYDTAQDNLGWMYGHGLGVSQDYQMALYWYRKSAAQGNKYAQNSLGLAYHEGQGVQVDYQQAMY